MKFGNTRTVTSFHKGLAQKFEIIFESGHVVAGKPILPEELFGLQQYEFVPYKEYILVSYRLSKYINISKSSFKATKRIKKSRMGISRLE